MLHPIVIALLAGVCAQEPPVRVVLVPGAPQDRPSRVVIDRPRSSEGFEQWQFWWEANQHELLDLRRRQREGVQGCMRARSSSAAAQEMALREVREELLPALLEALDDENPEIASAAAIAIGRVTPLDPSRLGLDALIRAAGSSSPLLRESAVLGLGILGDRRACEVLIPVMNDAASARGDRTGRFDGVRARAALALGLIGDPVALPHLERVVASEPRGSMDVIACAITALGLFTVQQREIVSFLVAQLSRKDLDARVLAQVPTAIARLGTAAARDTIPTLLEIARTDASDLHGVRSAALALGKLATLDQREVVDRLVALAMDHADAQTRHLAFMALAELAARDPASATSLEARRRIADLFLEQTAAPRPPTSLPWAAIGLALVARAQPDQQVRAAAALREAFLQSDDESYRAAIALGLGLLDEKESRAWLADALATIDDQTLGKTAIALGLMRHTTAPAQIREQLARHDLLWRPRLDLARALALLQDVGAVPALVADLWSYTLSRAVTAAEALALIGDRTALDPLKRTLLDRSVNPKVRSAAALAIGALAEKTDLPWRARLATGINYRAKLVVLTEILDEL